MTRRKLYYEQLVTMASKWQPDILDVEPRKQIMAAQKAIAETLNIVPSTALDRENLINQILFAKKYEHGESHIYRIAERFGEHLARTPVNIPTKLIPAKFGKSYCIEFPDSVRFKGKSGEYWHTAIVVVGGWDDRLTEIKIMNNDSALPEGASPMLSICLPDYDENGNCQFVNSYLSFPLLGEETLEECLLKVEEKKQDDLIIPRDAINYLVKCWLYIESGEPDLKNEAGIWTPTKKPKKRRQQLENTCRFDVVNVGYSFHEKLYHVDSTSVVGHFRWQPYGPGRAKLKYIWIDEHVRHFKKDEP